MDTVPVLVDDAPTTDGCEGHEVLATWDRGFEALLACEVVVKSPGISRYSPEVEELEEAGIPVRGGLGLWLADAPKPRVTCITGTKGKSTTTALVAHLLNGLGHVAAVGGNIGHPPWEPTNEAEPEYWVIETSSFQVPDLTSGPSAVAVTSLSPDHLDWHGSVERYYADKLSLCTKPGVRVALADGEDANLRAQAELMGSLVHWVGAAGPWAGALHLPGHHNQRNAAMAQAVVGALGVGGADDDELLSRIAADFEGLPSRCHSLGRVDGIEFVDDSLSTNVLPAQAALESFSQRAVALLVGGHDRGLDYEALGHTVAARRQPTLIVTMPDNGPRIGEAIRAVAPDVEVIDAPDLPGAVATAFDWSRSGGVILLSPAAPSFGHFADYRARARAFVDAAARYGTLS